MGPGRESKLYRPSLSSEGRSAGPHSTGGKPGMRGGFKKRRR
jgi:hypothetical protein